MQEGYEDDDDEVVELAKAELEKLGCTVEWTGLGWAVTR